MGVQEEAGTGLLEKLLDTLQVQELTVRMILENVSSLHKRIVALEHGKRDVEEDGPHYEVRDGCVICEREGPVPRPSTDDKTDAAYWCRRCERDIPASECELDEGEPSAGLQACMKHYAMGYGEHEVFPLSDRERFYAGLPVDDASDEPERCPEDFGGGRCARPKNHGGMHHGQRHAGWKECDVCLWKMPLDGTSDSASANPTRRYAVAEADNIRKLYGDQLFRTWGEAREYADTFPAPELLVVVGIEIAAAEGTL